eukprot:GFYU01006803.1.p1 GENE.GFYU01006803.1~~GFYU01006803.1.p1  ORF type:complete len:548 (+),score=149.15 GFYU01006803.1:99-1742(+)
MTEPIKTQPAASGVGPSKTATPRAKATTSAVGSRISAGVKAKTATPAATPRKATATAQPPTPKKKADEAAAAATPGAAKPDLSGKKFKAPLSTIQKDATEEHGQIVRDILTLVAEAKYQPIPKLKAQAAREVPLRILLKADEGREAFCYQGTNPRRFLSESQLSGVSIGQLELERGSMGTYRGKPVRPTTAPAKRRNPEAAVAKPKPAVTRPKSAKNTPTPSAAGGAGGGSVAGSVKAPSKVAGGSGVAGSRVSATKNVKAPSVITGGKAVPANADSAQSLIASAAAPGSTVPLRIETHNPRGSIVGSRVSKSAASALSGAGTVRTMASGADSANTQGATVAKKKPPPLVAKNEPTPKSSMSQFRKFYDESSLPVLVEFAGAKRKLKWRVERVKDLDLEYYVPLFFEGLRETSDPYCFIANQGVREMLLVGKKKRVARALPQIISSVQKALHTRNQSVIKATLEALGILADTVDELIVPHLAKICTMLNVFKGQNVKAAGDEIQYNQQKNNVLGDLVQDVLEQFEKHGGEEAYKVIKKFVPTYQKSV